MAFKKRGTNGGLLTYPKSTDPYDKCTTRSNSGLHDPNPEKLVRWQQRPREARPLVRRPKEHRVAGNIPGRTQTVAVAIYDAVESGNGAVARLLVLVVSAVALILLTLANRLSPSRV